MQQAQIYTIIALCVYAIAMALIGCISYGKSKTLDGFLIGGRKIGAYAGIISGLLTVGGATLVISLTSGFSAAAAKSPEMGVCAMAISLIVVPVVSLLTKKKTTDQERIEKIFDCYKED